MTVAEWSELPGWVRRAILARTGRVDLDSIAEVGVSIDDDGPKINIRCVPVVETIKVEFVKVDA